MADYLATNEWPGTGAVMEIEINFAGSSTETVNKKPYFNVSDIKSELVTKATNTSVEVVTTITMTQINDLTFKTDVVVPVGQYLRVYRVTPISDPIVDFVSLQVVSEQDLDNQARQTLFAVMEARDAAGRSQEYAEFGQSVAVAANAASAEAVTTANAASTAAAAAVNTANAATTTANTAAENASAALTAANDAEQHASNVEQLVVVAQDAAAAAADSAAQALAAANNAVTTANGVDAKATEALTTANAASSAATAASQTANAIAGRADTALETANAAQATANDAKNTADAVADTAAGAVTTANAAQSAANTATTTANAAQTAATAAGTAAAAAQSGVNSNTAAINTINTVTIPGVTANVTALGTRVTALETTAAAHVPSFVNGNGINAHLVLVDGQVWMATGVASSYPNAAVGRGVSGTTGRFGFDGMQQVVIPDASPVVKAASCGYNAMALTASGNLYVWGSNGQGQLGLGHTTAVGTPQLSTSGVLDLYSDYSGNSFNAGFGRFAIRKSDGVYVAGYNGNGALGLGDTTNRTSWTRTTTLTPRLFVPCGAGYQWTVMVTTDNHMYVTGYNAYGQLGTGNTTQLTSWTDVTAAWGLLELKF